MNTIDLFIAELEREAKTTRRALEQVPEGVTGFKPHPKSMELGYLATLVATMPSWITKMINDDELDLRPVGKESHRPANRDGGAELVKLLDETVAEAIEALSKTNEEHLMTNWQLKAAGHVVQEQARHLFIRDTINHWAHHRGQLTVYLRLNDAKVTSIYGPTADEPM
ncbi:MAG: damage-inducible protein DinB [Acidobacteria bacterium]|nr:damage-inducible protein DinB [Acidobacteriota bacterium]